MRTKTQMSQQIRLRAFQISTIRTIKVSQQRQLTIRFRNRPSKASIRGLETHNRRWKCRQGTTKTWIVIQVEHRKRVQLLHPESDGTGELIASEIEMAKTDQMR